MDNAATQISLIIQYKITDDANGIEESDDFSYHFDKFPTYNEVLEAWCRGTVYETPRNRDGVSFYFFASSTNNESLDCDYEW
jgi:hypothetical protein